MCETTEEKCIQRYNKYCISSHISPFVRVRGPNRQIGKVSDGYCMDISEMELLVNQRKSILVREYSGAMTWAIPGLLLLFKEK